jgi:precorrin-4 C11-methyltransferase
MSGKVIFIGAGPGAPDLITLRGRDALAAADIVIYAGSLVNPELLKLTKPEAPRHNSATMSLDEVIAVMEAAVAEGKTVARLHTGDPSVYGAISEQMNRLDTLKIDYEVIPGVSSVFAAAAALKCELTMPDITQSIILTRQPGRTPAPEAERISRLAANNASVAVFLSAGEIEDLAGEFIKAGRSPDTAAGVVYRASWPNQQIIRGTLADIAEKVRDAGIKRQAMIIVGDALKRSGSESLLYDKKFAHGHRNSENGPAAPVKTALYALTEKAALKAEEIAAGLKDASVFVSASCGQGAERRLFEPKKLAELIKGNWRLFDAHIFIMAAGIAVRKIAPLLRDKVSDPAVVVCDELGDHAVSLAGGHLGGANRLARRVAWITGGKAVITTATDCAGLTAFDEAAAQMGWRVTNPEMIREINSALMAGEIIDALLPPSVYEEFYGAVPNVRLIDSAGKIRAKFAVVLGGKTPDGSDARILRLTPADIRLGVGCRRGVSAEAVEEAVDSAMKEIGAPPDRVAFLASIDAKSGEAGLLEYAQKHRLRIKFFTAEELKRFDCPNPTPKAMEEFGVPGVAEPSALAAAGPGGKLILQKYKKGPVTIAAAIPGDRK